jgi:hypothetical protein
MCVILKSALNLSEIPAVSFFTSVLVPSPWLVPQINDQGSATVWLIEPRHLAFAFLSAVTEYEETLYKRYVTLQNVLTITLELSCLM